jgi:polysaccharide export outer membrane protein
MSRYLAALSLFALVLATPGRLGAQTDSGAARRGAVTAPLRSGDVVRVRIWREPDLSGDVTVNEAGVAVFPMIGPVDVRAMPPDSLKRHLTSAYAVYLRNPSIEITPLRKLRITGAVRNPGVYTVDLTTTVADAFATAGGAAADGSPDRVELRRANGERIRLSSRETRLTDTPIQSGDELYFHQRSWISRNPGIVAGTLTAVAGILVTVLTR